MGWSSGTTIAEPLIKVIQKQVDDVTKRQVIYEVLLEVLTNEDWDTVNEVEGIDPIFDSLAFDYKEE